MLVLCSVEQMIPLHHPLRRLKPLVDQILEAMSSEFDAMYAENGRHSVPPERLLKAMVLMALFSVRSERRFCDELGYNVLYRWFLDMDLSERPFDPTAFTRYRARLLEHDISFEFLSQTVRLARELDLMSDDHFSVDGTLIDAWASMKSFRPKDDDTGDNNGFADFKGTKRKNDTHESKTDPEARLFRKGRGKEAHLAYMAHALMENRHGLIADFELTRATGTAEREAALAMASRQQIRRGNRRRHRRMTLGADKGYDTKAFVASARQMGVTPHVAQFQHARRSSAIDGRTTRHRGYSMSQRSRLLIEKIFGWMKTIGGFRRSRFRGSQRTALAGRLVAATYNLLRISRLASA